MIAKPVVLALMLGVAAGAGAPAFAQTPVYVPSMGSTASGRLPSTVTSGPKVYVPPTGVSGRSQRS
ncbi:MAG: hypothetical protein HC900_11915, partial [Methylacidiphilales bacterium]|nr:hypothetical protein [Candidatus Methylacidiphilales bacterium]